MFKDAMHPWHAFKVHRQILLKSEAYLRNSTPSDKLMAPSTETTFFLTVLRNHAPGKIWLRILKLRRIPNTV